MTLTAIDWVIIGGFFAAIVAIGLIVARSSAKDSAEYFLGGRSLPWWLLGVSMVACTFSCDTPNLVAGMVREGGVVANWGWWAFLITGMVTVFIYAQLWRRSRVMTDLGFYELRYSGRGAAFIRGFRALYLGVFFNCLIMGTVTLAAIKIGQVIFDLDPLWAVLLGSAGVVIYATAGGIKSCIWADFFQYSIAMFGAVYAAIVACRQPEVGGLSALLTHPAVIERLSWMPDFSNWLAWVPLLLIPVAVQWWAVWYPGAEPGGGGYIAQRMLAAKNEKNAIGATLLFNVMHYAMRPWPWIIVALASLVCYPNLESIQRAFPGIDPTYLKPDIAYPVMVSRLGPGFLGLVIASLIAAYMSTIGTHLNWGSSYAVNDFYHRFVRPRASERELVQVGRICTVLLMVLAGFFALTFLEDAYQAFKILLLSGAGTGAIYLLRWFWWRINAWTEIVAMVVATVLACVMVLQVGNEGTLAWYVGSGAVEDRVYVVEDAAVVENVTAALGTAAAETAELEATLQERVAAWREARRQGDAARDAARAAYDESQAALSRFRAEHAVPVLLRAQAGGALSADIEAWMQDQRAQQQERDDRRRRRLGLESEAAAMPGFGGLIHGGRLYLYHPDVANLVFPVQLLVCVAFVTVAWILTAFLTPSTDPTVLRSFYRLCHPGGPGWRRVVADARRDGEEIDTTNAIGDWKLPRQILCVFLGCVAIYAALFAVGHFVYGHRAWGGGLCVLALGATVLLFKSLNRIGIETRS